MSLQDKPVEAELDRLLGRQSSVDHEIESLYEGILERASLIEGLKKTKRLLEGSIKRFRAMLRQEDFNQASSVGYAQESSPWQPRKKMK